MPSLVTAVDYEAAAELANLAGEQLLALRHSTVPSATLGANGDAMSHAFLIGSLAPRLPPEAARSEQRREDVVCASTQRLWFIDPRDATREFSGPPRQNWAAHVALVVEGIPVVGAVALPARGMTLSTTGPAMAPLTLAGPPRMLVSGAWPAEHTRELAERLGGQPVPMGSACARVWLRSSVKESSTATQAASTSGIRPRWWLPRPAFTCHD